MSVPAIASSRLPPYSTDALRERVDQSLAGQQLVQACLQATRTLAEETDERSVLLFYAMLALGRHPKGTSAIADFTVLFSELGLQECANTVRSGQYCALDLAFFWSSDRDFTRLFEASELTPARTYRSSTHARALPKTIMFDEWGECPFFEFDAITDPLPPRQWHLYHLDDATIVYDTTEFAVLDACGRPVPDLCSHHYQHVFFTPGFGAQMDRLLRAGEGIGW